MPSLHVLGPAALLSQVGVTSWGVVCAGAMPGVYTDLAYMRMWVYRGIKVGCGWMGAWADVQAGAQQVALPHA